MSGLLTRQPDDCSGCRWKHRFAEPVAPQDIDAVLSTCQNMLMRRQGQSFDRNINLQRGCDLIGMTKGAPDIDGRRLYRRSAYPCHAVYAVSFAAAQADHVQYRATQHVVHFMSLGALCMSPWRTVPRRQPGRSGTWCSWSAGHA